MTETAARRRRWAAALIRTAPNPPRYGSAEWHQLPEGSPAKIAGAVVAAECWAVEEDDLEDRLHEELADERYAFKRAEDEDYQARAQAHREQWRYLSVGPPPRYTGQVVRPLEDIGADVRRQLLAERRGAPQ